jgi:hypothetical protein
VSGWLPLPTTPLIADTRTHVDVDDLARSATVGEHQHGASPQLRVRRTPAVDAVRWMDTAVSATGDAVNPVPAIPTSTEEPGAVYADLPDLPAEPRSAEPGKPHPGQRGDDRPENAPPIRLPASRPETR